MKKRNSTIRVAKTKAPISFAVPLFSHRQKSCFLTAHLVIQIKHRKQLLHTGDKRKAKAILLLVTNFLVGKQGIP